LVTQVPIRCTITITLVCDIDVTEKTALKAKMTEVVNDLKTQFPDRIVENIVNVRTEFAEERWSV